MHTFFDKTDSQVKYWIIILKALSESASLRRCKNIYISILLIILVSTKDL